MKRGIMRLLLPVRGSGILHSNTLIFASKSNNFCAQKRQYLHSKTPPNSCVFAPGVTHWGSSGGTRWGTQTYKHMARKLDLTGRPNALIRGCESYFCLAPIFSLVWCLGPGKFLGLCFSEGENGGWICRGWISRFWGAPDFSPEVLSLVALYRAMRLRFGTGSNRAMPTARETSKTQTLRNTGPFFFPHFSLLVVRDWSWKRLSEGDSRCDSCDKKTLRFVCQVAQGTRTVRGETFEMRNRKRSAAAKHATMPLTKVLRPLNNNYFRPLDWKSGRPKTRIQPRQIQHFSNSSPFTVAQGHKHRVTTLGKSHGSPQNPAEPRRTLGETPQNPRRDPTEPCERGFWAFWVRKDPAKCRRIPARLMKWASS